jgi:N-acetylglutamate synthase-like GNAT family acetyltransferase
MTHRLKEIIFRNYEGGDETRLVHFLNFCYEKWGDLRKWRYLHLHFPSFESTNIIIAEHKGKIVGHGGMHARELVISQNCKLSAVILCAGAVHPDYRRIGLHSRLLNQRLRIAKSNGVSLAFGWTQKGSGAYKSDTKFGFVEISQSAAYMKIIRPDKIFQLGLINLLRKNQKLRRSLINLGFDLQFCFEQSTISVTNLVGEPQTDHAENKKCIKFFLDKNSQPKIANFRNMTKIQIISTLLPLFFLKRLKIKFSSFKTFLTAIKKGVQLIGSL